MKKLFTLLLIFLSFSGFSQCWQKISAGGHHVLSTKLNGDFYGWGQEGIPPTPIPVLFGNSAQSISCGTDHSLVVKTDGTLWGVGSNYFGNMGLGIGSPYWVNNWTQLGTATNWQSVAAGNSVTLALKTDGTLWACGYNNKGQLGNNSVTNSYDLIQVGSDSNWIKISAGGGMSAAIKSDGTLWTWGSNANGALGNGINFDLHFPFQVGFDTNWESVSAGGSHMMALKTDGTLWSWGWNSQGQLGIGTFANSNVPVQVGIDSDWQTVESGSYTTMALKTNGSLWVCGSRTGDGTTINRNTFINITPEITYQAISTANRFCVAIKSDGGIWHWGLSNDNVLGNGNSNLDEELVPTSLNNSNYCVLGPNDFEKNDIILYPNPTSEFVYIDNRANIIIEKIILSDISGKILFETVNNFEKIDLLQYFPGVYFVQIESNTGKFLYKVIRK